MRHFCTAPLQVTNPDPNPNPNLNLNPNPNPEYTPTLQALGLERFVTSVSRAALGHPEVSDSLGFDLTLTLTLTLTLVLTLTLTLTR